MLLENVTKINYAKFILPKKGGEELEEDFFNIKKDYNRRKLISIFPDININKIHYANINDYNIFKKM